MAYRSKHYARKYGIDTPEHFVKGTHKMAL